MSQHREGPPFLKANAAILVLILAGFVLAVVGFVGGFSGSGATPAAARDSDGSIGPTPSETGDPTATVSPSITPSDSPSATPATSTSAATPPRPNLALQRPVTISDGAAPRSVSTLTDGNAGTVWQGASGFPQTVTVDLGAAQTVRGVQLSLPTAASWTARTQTLSVQSSADGTSFQPVLGGAGYPFRPTADNTVALAMPNSTLRYLRLTITANSGAAGGQLGELSVFASPPPGSPTATVGADLALHCPATATSQIRADNAGSYATDGDAATYWEGAHHGLPQSLTIDLLAPTSVARIVVKLPVGAQWPSRKQTLTVLGSTTGSAFTVLRPSAAYSFTSTPNTNDATFTVPPTSIRFLRLDFTDNSQWDAGQAGEVEVYS